MLVDRVLRVEVLPPPGGDAPVLAVQERPGGAGLNVACALARLRIPCVVVSRVGEDDAGRRLIDFLAVSGVDPSFVAVGDVTGTVVSVVDGSAQRTMFSWRGAAAGAPRLTRRLEMTLRAAPFLFLSGYWLREPLQAAFCLDMARIAKETAVIVALDPGPSVSAIPGKTLASMVLLTDVLLAGEDELTTLLEKLSPTDRLNGPARGESLQACAQRALAHVPCVAIKLGARGAALAADLAGGRAATAGPVPATATASRVPPRLLALLSAALHGATAGLLWLTRPAEPIEATDTTGAGDAFDAGFMAAVACGLPPQRWLEWGNRAAADLLARHGRPPGRPTTSADG
ncbi:MAG: carbohydrate kinase family protein [Limnochordaceae bacterium]|nr:carbohydrate kinase family protein [Limnochordaceae bacterium]